MILIGFMGSGKTTVGTLLAKEQNCPFIDLDRYIVERTGQSIPNIFKVDGEQGFRKLEYEALNNCSDKDAIIATGGGIVTYKQSFQHLEKTTSTIIYLEISFEVAYQRIKGDLNRPLIQVEKEKLKAIYDSRLNLYETLAHKTINAEQPLEEIIYSIKE